MADINRAFDFIAEDNPRAAKTTVDRVLQALESLPELPHRGRQGRVSDTRELVIPRTSYIAIYRVDDQAVSVTRVLHSHQNWPSE